jgi:predicted MFS family arabinose efflux permease
MSIAQNQPCALGRRPPHEGVERCWVLGRRASLWVSLGVAAHTLWTSAAPALSYRLYAHEWHLSPLETAGVFAVYPVFVVGTLVLLGDLSDAIGRRLIMLGALACSLAGALMLASAPGIEWLFAARALMGVAVGLASGASTAAILEFDRDRDAERAAMATNVAQASGFAMALLLGGVLIQYAPWPLQLNFLALAAVIIVLMAGVWFLPQGSTCRRRWSPRLPTIPAVVRGIFPLVTLAVTVAFASGAMFLALGGQMAHDLVGSENALINGAVLANFAVVSAAATGLGRNLPVRTSLLTGAIAILLGVSMLWCATLWQSVILLLAATSSAGVGYALLFLGSLTLINAAAPAAQRGGVLSAFYLVGYLSMGAFAITLGFIARTWALRTAIATGSSLLIALAIATLAVAVHHNLPDSSGARERARS